MPRDANSTQTTWFASKPTLPTGSTRSTGTTVLSRNSAAQRWDDSTAPSERKAQALLNTIPDWVFVLKRDGTITECHPPPQIDPKFRPGDLTGKRVAELLPVAVAQQIIYYLEKTLRTGKQQTFGANHLLGANPSDFQLRIAPCGPDEVLALVRDVTDRKLLEREILEISNREQMRIGQDLHDGLGQHLTGITFLARALENKLAARALPEASEAAEICQLVLQALTQTRNLARGLFPVELESAGLVAGLNDLAATVSKLFNITCRVELADPVEVTERNLAHHVFRIAQEAINNAVRHGKAQEIVIRLTQMDDVTLLSIVDNGTGFDPDVNPQHGLGLRIMNYRAQKIGAQLTITSAHPKGTLVTCTFPNQAG